MYLHTKHENMALEGSFELIQSAGEDDPKHPIFNVEIARLKRVGIYGYRHEHHFLPSSQAASF